MPDPAGTGWARRLLRNRSVVIGGSVFLLLEAALGLEADALRRRIVLHQPQLPAWLPWLEVRNLRVGEARVDLNVVRGKYGGSVKILRKEGELEVVETR